MSLKLRECCTQGSSGLKVNVSSWLGGNLPLVISQRTGRVEKCG